MKIELRHCMVSYTLSSKNILVQRQCEYLVTKKMSRKVILRQYIRRVSRSPNILLIISDVAIIIATKARSQTIIDMLCRHSDRLRWLEFDLNNFVTYIIFHEIVMHTIPLPKRYSALYPRRSRNRPNLANCQW